MFDSMSTKRAIVTGNVCGAKVKVLRKKLGMAQIDLAEALNVDFGYTFNQSDIFELRPIVRKPTSHANTLALRVTSAWTQSAFL